MRRVTLCLAYYENAGMLAEQLLALMRLPETIRRCITLIVVDDGSPTAPAAIPPGDYGFETRVYRMREDIPWNQDACRNLAVAEAATDWVLLTDMDHVPTAKLWQRVVEGVLEPKTVYTFRRVSAPAMEAYKPHPNSWLLTRALFERSGGYDERFRGVYGTDGIFAKRLHGVTRRFVELKEALIRYPRDVIPDASTTTLTRKSVENEVRRGEVKALIKASGNRGPMRGLTAWDRVA